MPWAVPGTIAVTAARRVTGMAGLRETVICVPKPRASSWQQPVILTSIIQQHAGYVTPWRTSPASK